MADTRFIYADVMGYFKDGRRCRYYNDAIAKAKAFTPHADGEYPQELIECRRPNEPEEVKEYRMKIWKPKTKPAFSKIISSLSKIRRSSDWSITHPDAGDSPLIAEEETLERYAEFDYPYFGSVTNWVFAVLLKKYLTDPNAVIMVMPLNREPEETEYIKPYAWIFESCHVIEFIEGESAILEIEEGCLYTRGKHQEKGRSFYTFNQEVIERWDQVNVKGDFIIVWSYSHGLAMLPAFKIGAVICSSDGNNFLYESRIEGIIPDLDEALREYSDLQAAKVLHIFPERWEFTQNECTDCKGTGKRHNPNWYVGCPDTIPSQVTCTANGCNNGYIASGPYSKLLLRPSNAMEGSAAIPTPPAGYVEKDVEIVKLMEASVKGHIYDALASINFQFLEQTPLNQSGTAKEVDKEELNNTVHAIAEDLVRVMDRVYRLIGRYRYRVLYAWDIIEKMLPSIAVPDHFDLLSSQFMQQEVDTAKKSTLNPVIVNAMEVEYAGKRFINEPEVRDMLSLILQLDPLPNISEDSKMSMLSNKGITLETYIISSNIQEFVQRAIDENIDFASVPLKEQKAKMKTYAAEQIAAQEAARVSLDQGGLGANGQPQENADIIGKIPLAVQQLSLAATRAADAGDAQLAATIKAKINQLLGQVVEATEEEIA